MHPSRGFLGIPSSITQKNCGLKPSIPELKKYLKEQFLQPEIATSLVMIYFISSLVNGTLIILQDLIPLKSLSKCWSKKRMYPSLTYPFSKRAWHDVTSLSIMKALILWGSRGIWGRKVTSCVDPCWGTIEGFVFWILKFSGSGLFNTGKWFFYLDRPHLSLIRFKINKKMIDASFINSIIIF